MVQARKLEVSRIPFQTMGLKRHGKQFEVRSVREEHVANQAYGAFGARDGSMNAPEATMARNPILTLISPVTPNYETDTRPVIRSEQEGLPNGSATGQNR